MKYIRVGNDTFVAIMAFFGIYVILGALFLDIIPNGIPLNPEVFNFKTIVVIFMIIDLIFIWGILKISNYNEY